MKKLMAAIIVMVILTVACLAGVVYMNSHNEPVVVEKTAAEIAAEKADASSDIEAIRQSASAAIIKEEKEAESEEPKVEEEEAVEEEEELLEVTPDIENGIRLYNLDVAAMLADELIKKENNLDQAGLEELLERADKVAEGGAADLRQAYMHGEEFNRIYTKITGEEFNKDEYRKSDYMSHVPTISEERKAELQAEAAAEMAEYAAEIEAKKAAEAEKLEQLEKEKAMLEQAAQQREQGAAPKYGSLYTEEELAEMGTVEDYIATPKYSDEEVFSGPAIEGFH